MTCEPDRCTMCDAPDPDGDYDGTLCRRCVEAFTGDDGLDFVAADDDARERALDQRVEEHLDRERELRHGR